MGIELKNSYSISNGIYSHTYTNNVYANVFGKIAEKKDYTSFIKLGRNNAVDSDMQVNLICGKQSSIVDCNFNVSKGELFVRRRAEFDDTELSTGTLVGEVGLCDTATSNDVVSRVIIKNSFMEKIEGKKFSVEVCIYLKIDVANGVMVVGSDDNELVKLMFGMSNIDFNKIMADFSTYPVCNDGIPDDSFLTMNAELTFDLVHNQFRLYVVLNSKIEFSDVVFKYEEKPLIRIKYINDVIVTSENTPKVMPEGVFRFDVKSSKVSSIFKTNGFEVHRNEYCYSNLFGKIKKAESLGELENLAKDIKIVEGCNWYGFLVDNNKSFEFYYFEYDILKKYILPKFPTEIVYEKIVDVVYVRERSCVYIVQDVEPRFIAYSLDSQTSQYSAITITGLTTKKITHVRLLNSPERLLIEWADGTQIGFCVYKMAYTSSTRLYATQQREVLDTKNYEIYYAPDAPAITYYNRIGQLGLQVGQITANLSAKYCAMIANARNISSYANGIIVEENKKLVAYNAYISLTRDASDLTDGAVGFVSNGSGKYYLKLYSNGTFKLLVLDITKEKYVETPAMKLEGRVQKFFVCQNKLLMSCDGISNYVCYHLFDEPLEFKLGEGAVTTANISYINSLVSREQNNVVGGVFTFV